VLTHPEPGGPIYCQSVAVLLPLKYLTDNDVTDVATLRTMSSCNTHLKPLIINIVAGISGCFCNAPFTPTSGFLTGSHPGEDGVKNK
jgi:hypothetical protein